MSTLMQRLMAAKLAKTVPKQPEVKAHVPWAERRARIAEGHAYRNAPVEPSSEPLQFKSAPVHPGKVDMNDPPPSPPQPGAPRGSCKALNAETGRQCALLAGHTKPHRHGSTEFTRVAKPGQSAFSRRDALDALATRHDSSTPTGET